MTYALTLKQGRGWVHRDYVQRGLHQGYDAGGPGIGVSRAGSEKGELIGALAGIAPSKFAEPKT